MSPEVRDVAREGSIPETEMEPVISKDTVFYQRSGLDALLSAINDPPIAGEDELPFGERRTYDAEAFSAMLNLQGGILTNCRNKIYSIHQLIEFYLREDRENLQKLGIIRRKCAELQINSSGTREDLKRTIEEEIDVLGKKPSKFFPNFLLSRKEEKIREETKRRVLDLQSISAVIDYHIGKSQAFQIKIKKMYVELLGEIPPETKEYLYQGKIPESELTVPRSEKDLVGHTSRPTIIPNYIAQEKLLAAQIIALRQCLEEASIRLYD